MKIDNTDGSSTWLLEKSVGKDIRTAIVTFSPSKLTQVGSIRRATPELVDIKLVFTSILNMDASIDIYPVFKGTKTAAREYWQTLRDSGFNLSPLDLWDKE